jgi:hypothetical protein
MNRTITIIGGGVIAAALAYLTAISADAQAPTESSSASFGASGVYGLSAATSGTTFGVYGEAASTSGRGVYGYASSTGGINYGGRFETPSGSGYGVYALNSSDGYGGYFRSNNGIGAAGYSFVLSGIVSGLYGGSQSSSGRGVTGYNFSDTGTTYGVYGIVDSGNGYAVYASGDSGASGTKSFRIDHPFDPTGKYLLHYSSESPKPQNFYNGNVVTDTTGYAWVELPDYFEEINANFKYQLTVVSDSESFVQAMVSKKIHGNRFQIRTSAPNVEVSWRVDADRNDLYVRNRKPKDVIDKSDFERGKYQHPELYGEPREMGMNFMPQAKLESRAKR